MGEVLVVQSKIRELVKKSGANMAGDFVDGLSKEVNAIITKAVARAKANGRKTVRATDL